MSSTLSRFKTGLVAAALLASGSASAEAVYGITDVAAASAPSLVMFDTAAPAASNTIGVITGIVAGQTLRGIDFRPSNGLLYGVSSSASGTAAQLYTINRTTGVATTVGPGFALSGNTNARVSIDFNPVPDALRVVTGDSLSYRVNPNTGALILQDTPLSPNSLYADVAYTNNVAGATMTTLYTYDYSNDTLGRIGGVNGAPSPNGGAVTTIGSTGVAAFSGAVGLDISGLTGLAYGSLDEINSPDANSEFYSVNLATGLFSLIGNFSFALLDFSIAIAPRVVPEPGVLAMFGIGLAGLAGFARRRRKA